MALFTSQPSLVKKAILTGLTVVLILSGSLLQGQILKVEAAVQVLVVSDTAIPFGTVFPEEVLDKTYTVRLDTSAKASTYDTVLEALPATQDLCPHLAVSSLDVPAEADTLAAATLQRPADTVDNWQVRLTVPGLQGQVAQDHEGNIVVSGGDYACKITITPAGEVHGMKFEDKNGDGKKNHGDPGLPGWTIYLDSNDNGLLDNGEQSVVTNQSGEYWFMSLAPGTYHVREVILAGWIQTRPKHSDKYDVTLTRGQIVTGKDFGNFKLGEIHGMKFEDKNGNGRKDPGEPGLPGWTIELKGPHGFKATAVTDSQGRYWFMDLGPGKYKVSEEKRKGWKQTTHNPEHIQIQSGTISEGNDFGNQKKK